MDDPNPGLREFVDVEADRLVAQRRTRELVDGEMRTRWETIDVQEVERGPDGELPERLQGLEETDPPEYDRPE